MTVFSNLADLAVLNAGRNPKWTAQPTVSAPNGQPTLATDGVALQGAIVAMVGCNLHAGEWLVDVDAWDASVEYDVFLDSEEYIWDAYNDASLTETLQILAGLINAGEGPGTARVDGDLLWVKTTKTVTAGGSGGAVVDVTAGATAVDLVIWLYSGGEWGAPADGVLSITRNLIERAEVAGAERAYIEIVSTDGMCTPRIGPCGLEG